MMKNHFSLILIAALVLGACSPPPQEFDWCYTYNFALGDYGINIASGEWQSGVGIISVDNQVIVNWETEYFVDSSRVSVVIRRGDGVTGIITISAIAEAFGIEISNSGALPSDIDEIQPYGDDENPAESTKTVNATIQSNAQIIISSMTISGYGVNPFPQNECGPATVTPTASTTYTPAPTLTPSPIPTNSPTPTPTGTPPACFRLDYDFTTSAYNASLTGRTWSSGTGFSNISFHPNNLEWSRYLSLNFDSGSGFWAINISRIEFDIAEFTPGDNLGDFEFRTTAAGGGGQFTQESGPITSSTMAFELESSLSVRGIGMFMYVGRDITFPHNTDPGGAITIDAMRVWGTGTVPTGWSGTITYLPCWDITPTPTLTPSATVATNTPTNTLTRTPLPITPQTATATRTNIVVSSATPAPTFTLTNTLIPSLPPAPSETPGPSATPVDTRTLIPLPTSGEGTPTAEGTYGLPNFGTLPPDPVFATLIGTMPPDVTPLLTGIPLPAYKSDVYNYVSTAAAGINQLPSDITSQIPEVGPGLSLFGQYAKGLTSGVSLQELLGKKLYPIGVHVFYAIAVVFSMSVIYALVYIGVEVIKFVIWVIGWILKIIGAIAGAA